MQKPHHIVFTTINHPEILNDLHANISRFGHLDTVKVWIIGDHKTPATAAAISNEVTAKGLECVYMGIATQDDWGKNIAFYSRIPYNSDARRIVGYLKALEDGCKILIAIDDDNFPTDDDFIGAHAKTGMLWPGEILNEPAGFHNVCEYLKFEPSRQIFARGFPFKLRGELNKPEKVKAPAGASIGVTEGLWLKEPDVDATTWLNGRINGVAFNGSDQIVLHQKTWSPINTQNVSVVRELLPAYFYVPMAWPVPGGKIDRYGDIWGGYFLQALLQGTNYHVSFGRPLVEHRRNPHVYIDDLRYEFWGMILTDWLLEQLRGSFSSGKSDILERTEDLGEFLKAAAQSNMPSWSPPEMREFLVHTGDSLKLWAETCRKIGI